MNKKLIAVCGSTGAGKSTLALALAHYLSAKKRRSVVLISPDKVTPMLPVFCPFDESIDTVSSLGKLSLEHITFDLVSTKLRLHPKNSNLAFLAYAQEDTSKYHEDFSEIDIENILSSLIDVQGNVKNSFCDYVIVDCVSNLLDCRFSRYSVNHAWLLLNVLQPTKTALSYEYSKNSALYYNPCTLNVLNNCYPFSPYKQIGKELDTHHVVMHQQKLYEKFITGTVFGTASSFENLFGDVLEKLER